VSGVEAQHYEQAELWGEGQVFLPDHQQLRLDAIDDLLPGDVRLVADVGAGDGRVLHHLAGSRPELVPVALERSRTALGHVGTLRVQASGEARPLADRSVDAVLSCEVLEHLPTAVYRATLHELARVTGRYVLITVPNQERRAAADVVCPDCGCRFNRERHLRSFHPRDLPDLLPGCDLVELRQAGPRQPVYPRLARQVLERAGVLTPPGSPSCPQCGARYTGRAGTTPDAAARPPAGPVGPDDGAPPDGDAPGRASSRYRRIRQLAPKARHPYWLLALYRRR
jgi:SAM-dependent methyltransferase